MFVIPIYEEGNFGIFLYNEVFAISINNEVEGKQV